MSLSLDIYARSPIFLQHVLTTYRGVQLRRLRYTRHLWETLEFLQKSQYWSVGDHEQYQVQKLRGLIKHAMTYSPYYAELYGRKRIKADDVRSVRDIALLPIIAKDEFRANNERFVSTHLPRKKMWAAYTSGTTGTPLTAYHTHTAFQERFAYLERLFQWYNPKRFRRRASFTGKLIVPPHDERGPFHRMNLAIRQQLYSSHHLKKENLDRYIEELADYQPEQVDGIASPLYVVGDHLLRYGRAGAIKPRVVIPSSETLWPHIRDRIERGFQAPVSNQYGSQEGAPIAYECPDGGFHTCPESGIFEILTSEGSPAAPGQLGRLVVTSLLSEGTPLIRYDIGDIAAWREGVCKCGRQMPMLLTVEGRRDDMFYTREKGVVPRIDSAFKSMPSSIIATQVAQVAIDRFEVRIIPDAATYVPSQGDAVVEHLHDYLGRSVHIELKIVSDLPRTSGGKLRAMANEAKDPEVRNAIVGAWNETVATNEVTAT